MNWRIPLADLDFGPEEEAAVLDVLRRRWLTMGAVTEQFEAAFATLVGVPHALAVTNCTAALHLAGAALGWQPGDEVIVPSLTFVATVNAVRYTGATPIFADVSSLDDFSLSPDDIAAKITPRTRAIIVMHYGGYACDMARINELVQQHGLDVIEDAAHAPAASLDGRALGTWGTVGCYSFFSNKNMTTGEGGMLVTTDAAVAEKLRLLRSHGMTTLTWDRHRGHAFSYDVVAPGYNYRIDEMRAALGCVQLNKLAANNERRRMLDRVYVESLRSAVPDLTLPYQNHPGVSACHVRPILLPPTADRQLFMERLKERGIQTSIHYPPVHQFHYYRALMNGNTPLLPLTEEIARREVTLPLYPAMTPSDIELVVAAVAEALS